MRRDSFVSNIKVVKYLLYFYVLHSAHIRMSRTRTLINSSSSSSSSSSLYLPHNIDKYSMTHYKITYITFF